MKNPMRLVSSALLAFVVACPTEQQQPDDRCPWPPERAPDQWSRNVDSTGAVTYICGYFIKDDGLF